ncbi:MAG: hypothetical protein K9M03_01810 [Kiritimatiellales bacterium]|nr:hypothetical protein [Kiritimatiellales bacterium]
MSQPKLNIKLLKDIGIDAKKLDTLSAEVAQRAAQIVKDNRVAYAALIAVANEAIEIAAQGVLFDTEALRTRIFKAMSLVRSKKKKPRDDPNMHDGKNRAPKSVGEITIKKGSKRRGYKSK